MSNASPTAFLLWAILSVLFQIFLVHHLWCYDNFKCLRWSAGRQPGAFKRLMTYSYLCSVPMFVVYSVAMTVIKYKEGFIVTNELAIIPTPIDLYRPPNKDWVIPLDFVFSIAWGLELVTHLEELAFWLYLLHQNPHKEAWFSSWEYRLWSVGSMIAIIGMPLTALVTRKQTETCDAYIFLVGSAGSTSTTLSFLYVLWRFPRFIRHVKSEGADPAVVVRLATFYQLNQARVVFRFLFTLPLLVLALDGIVGTAHVVNRNLFWTDFLQMIAGIGCFLSTMITLLIFFPRSIVKEAGYKPKASSTVAQSPKSAPITPPSLTAPFTSPPNLHAHPAYGQPTMHTVAPARWEVEVTSSAVYESAFGTERSREQDLDDDYDPEQGPDEPADGEVEEERAPPYPLHLYQRHPFPHSLSSPQILVPAMPSPPSPPPPSPFRIDIAPPPPTSPKHASGELRRPRSEGVRRGLHVVASGPGTPPVGVGLGVGSSHMGSRRASILHPYVMTFTSPIDLIDLQQEFPRTM